MSNTMRINPDGTIENIAWTQAEIDQKNSEIAADSEQKIRASKVAEIKAEGLSRIGVHLPDVDTFDEVDLLKMIGPAFQLSASGQSAKDIYAYAKTKVQQANTAPIAQVIAYDPTSDVGWP